MAKVDVKIMAVPKRRDLVLDILYSLGLDENIVVYDDRPNGGDAMYTATKCWLSPIAEGVTHRLVLQDDVALCNDFLEIIERIANAYPEPIFTLYSSRVKPDMRLGDSPYVQVVGESIWGQGIMMPIKTIKPCFEWIWNNYGKDYPHDDRGIGYYAHENGIPVFTTIPSTLQHLCPTKSALGYNNKRKVSKVWQGFDIGSENWESPDYARTPLMLNG